MKYIALFLTTLSLFAFASAINAQTFRLSTAADAEKETVTLSFSGPANATFFIYEARPQASSTTQCLASTDFSSAVPVGPDRVSVSFDPSMSTWYLRSTSPLGTVDSCSVLLVRHSSVDAHDYIAWRRARFSETSLFDEAVHTDKESDSATTQRTRVTSLQVTFSAQTTF